MKTSAILPWVAPTKRGLADSLTAVVAHTDGQMEPAAIHAAILRLLVLFLADGRGLLPEGNGGNSPWERLRRKIARQAGSVNSEVTRRLAEACPSSSSSLVRRIEELLGQIGSQLETVERPYGATSDFMLAQIIDALSRQWPGEDEPVWIDYRQCDVRLLGDLYEALLRLSSSSVSPSRKCTGTFYTPASIIDSIVEQTLGPALEERLERIGTSLKGVKTSAQLEKLLEVLLSFRMVDPSMGTGHFLVAATRFIVDRVMERLEPALRSNGAFQTWLSSEVVSRSIYGIDIDPLAVELARACLWLEFGLSAATMRTLHPHLRCCDALEAEAGENVGFPAHFDVVIGNPPYGAKRDAAQRKSALRQWPQMRHNGDTAVGFLELAHRWTASGGRCGLIVPKPLTYSFAWRQVRQLLGSRLEQIVDVSRAWHDVKLEQVIVVLGVDGARDDFVSRVLQAGALTPSVRVPRKLVEEIGAWPCGLSSAQCDFVASLLERGPRLGELCRTFRGLPWQSRLSKEGELQVVGGRDLERWRVRGCSGWIDAGQSDMAAFKCEKLLFQNIVAHVAHPRPHLLLIGSYDARQLVTLDTVNNLVWRHENGRDLRGVLVLLHSKLINWFIYQVIYSQAIRTMHFDQYFLDKVPLPVEFEELFSRLAPMGIEMERSAEVVAAAVQEFMAAVESEGGRKLTAKVAKGALLGDSVSNRQSRLPQELIERCQDRAIAEQCRQQRLYGELNRMVDEAYGAVNVVDWWRDD